MACARAAACQQSLYPGPAALWPPVAELAGRLLDGPELIDPVTVS